MRADLPLFLRPPSSLSSLLFSGPLAQQLPCPLLGMRRLCLQQVRGVPSTAPFLAFFQCTVYLVPYFLVASGGCDSMLIVILRRAHVRISTAIICVGQTPL